jgi:hypothetical protein
MAKVSKSKFQEKLSEFMEVFVEKLQEDKQEMELFLKEEVFPNAPALTNFGKINPHQHPHPTLGTNVHQLHCGRCLRPTRVPIPLGMFNAIWACDCGVQTYAEEDEFIKCPSCSKIMTLKMRFKPGDPVYFDYLCKTCRDNKESQLAVTKSGGAIILCPECHTTGVLPKTDKKVIEFRKKNGLPETAEVRFMLQETQCPRCADTALHRVFTEEEQHRVILLDEDVEKGIHRVEPEEPVTKGGKRVSTKKSKKSAEVVGDPARDKDDREVQDPDEEVLFPHPGSKVYH